MQNIKNLWWLKRISEFSVIEIAKSNSLLIQFLDAIFYFARQAVNPINDLGKKKR